MARDFKYDGKWKNNLREGKGILTDRLGKYAGTWKLDKQNGRGLFTSIVDNSVSCMMIRVFTCAYI